MTWLASVHSTLNSYWRWSRQHPRLTLLAMIALSSLIALWLLTRPGAYFGPQDTTWLRSQINKDLYVGIDPSYPPFAEWTPEGIEGLEADLAREIGVRLGVKTSILIMGYDGLYDSLYTGTVDMIISGLTVDTSYTEWVHYSSPYFDAGQVLISRVAEPYQDIRELDGKTIAVESATTGDIAAQQWQRRLHALDIVRVMQPEDAIQAVQRGAVAAALVDTVTARLMLPDYPDLMLAEHTTVSEEFVIALRQDNFRMTEAVEQALADMRRDGTLDALIDKWL